MSEARRLAAGRIWSRLELLPERKVSGAGGSVFAGFDADAFAVHHVVFELEHVLCDSEVFEFDVAEVLVRRKYFW